jgi:hypothetical protein
MKNKQIMFIVLIILVAILFSSLQSTTGYYNYNNPQTSFFGRVASIFGQGPPQTYPQGGGCTGNIPMETILCEGTDTLGVGDVGFDGFVDGMIEFMCLPNAHAACVYDCDKKIGWFKENCNEICSYWDTEDVKCNGITNEIIGPYCNPGDYKLVQDSDTEVTSGTWVMPGGITVGRPNWKFFADAIMEPWILCTSNGFAVYQCSCVSAGTGGGGGGTITPGGTGSGGGASTGSGNPGASTGSGTSSGDCSVDMAGSTCSPIECTSDGGETGECQIVDKRCKCVIPDVAAKEGCGSYPACDGKCVNPQEECFASDSYALCFCQ